MSLRNRIILLTLVILAGLLLAGGLARASQGAQTALLPPPTPTALPVLPALDSPNISTLLSPSPSCVLPVIGSGDCYLTWYYLYANADPNYIISTTVEIDGQMSARYNGFFQKSMYVPTEMLTFRVSCGAPGAGGDPNFGNLHSFKLRARDSAGLSASNQGTVFCPADMRQFRLPMVWK